MYLGFFAPDEENRAWLKSSVYPYLVSGLLCLAIAAARGGAWSRRIAWGSFLGATGLIFVFTLGYGVPDPAPYLLPAVGISMIGLASGLAWVAGSLHSPAIARGLAVIGLVACLAWGAEHAIDARQQREAILRFDRDVRRLWEQVPSGGGILLWPTDQINRLVEYQVLGAEKSAVWVTTPEFLLDKPALDRVRERYGLDLMAGLTIPYAPRSEPWGAAVRQRFFETVIARLNAGTRVPIYWFDLSGPRVILLPKPQRKD
jgi:hypothetical protein